MRHAFTVIELLIVISIIAIVVAVAVLATQEEQTAPVATSPVPAWDSEWVNGGMVDTYVITSPDGQKWVVFCGVSGTAALPYIPRNAPAKPVGPE